MVKVSFRYKLLRRYNFSRRTVVHLLQRTIILYYWAAVSIKQSDEKQSANIWKKCHCWDTCDDKYICRDITK